MSGRYERTQAFRLLVSDLSDEVAAFFYPKSGMSRDLPIEHLIKTADGTSGNHPAMDPVFQYMAWRGTSYAVAVNEQLNIIGSGGAEQSMNS